MILAIFDLDDTLTLQDTESLWQEYLVEKGFIDPKIFATKNVEFHNAYHCGKLQFDDVIAFSMGSIAHLNYQEQYHLQQDFRSSFLKDTVLPQAQELVHSHYEQGHHILILSAGHEFLIEPACSYFLFHDILCSRLIRDSCGKFHPILKGPALYKEQKVYALKNWLHKNHFHPIRTHFYSDSINDLPLLQHVDYPVAVNPCPRLREIAQLRHWPILDLKNKQIMESALALSEERELF